MELLYATTNQGKVISLETQLTPYGFTVRQAPLDIPEPRSSDVEEIAAAKARYAFSHLKRPVVALDAGFYIDELKGFPRAYVNFALDTIGLGGILKLVDGRSRACEFRHCLAYMEASLPEPMLFTDHVRGELANAKRGTLQAHHWSVLSLVFIPAGTSRTLAELSFDEYQNWRARDKDRNHYSKQFAEWFLTNNT